MDITKLDFNWGGAGYPSYDGRMEDGEGEPLDSQGRVEAALAAFGGDQGGEQRQDDQQQQQADGQQQQQDGQQRQDDQQQQQVEGQLTDEQRQADPVLKELNEFKTAIDAVFEKHGLGAAAEQNGRTPHEEADLQLADANTLYQIMRGERTPSNLLDTMVTVGNWQKPQVDAVANDMMAWLTKQGYLKGGQGAAQPGEKKSAAKAGDAGFKDPLEERLNKIETAQQQRDRQEQERVQKVERDRVDKIFVDHVNKLCTDAGIPKEDQIFYAEQIAALVNGNPAITKRVGQNNFVDIKRFFDTVHNYELKRLDRYSKAQLEKQKNKDKNPKVTAGGGTAASACEAKRNFANRDERIAAGLQAFTS